MQFFPQTSDLPWKLKFVQNLKMYLKSLSLNVWDSCLLFTFSYLLLVGDICSQYSISAATLKDHWQAFKITNASPNLDLKSFRKFTHYMKEQESTVGFEEDNNSTFNSGFVISFIS